MGNWAQSHLTQNGAGAADYGVLVMGTSALLALNNETGKRDKDTREAQTFISTLPKLANEGLKVVIAERVMDSVRSVMHERMGIEAENQPVIKLLEEIEAGRIANMAIERTDPTHDSFNATKALVGKYAKSGKPTFLMSNNTASKEDRQSMLHTIAEEHPEVAMVTTSAYLHELAATGVSHKFGIHSKTFKGMLKHTQSGTECSDVVLVPAIDIRGLAYRTLEGSKSAKLGRENNRGPLGEVLEMIAKTKKHVAPAANGHSGGLAPAASYSEAALSSKGGDGELPPL